MDLAEVKLLVLVLCGASGLLGVAAAQWIAGAGWGRALALANALASGVLLAAGLVCMLPDAAEGLPGGHAYAFAGGTAVALVAMEELSLALAQSGRGDGAGAGAPLLLGCDCPAARAEPQPSGGATAGCTSNAFCSDHEPGCCPPLEYQHSCDWKAIGNAGGDECCYQRLDGGTPAAVKGGSCSSEPVRPWCCRFGWVPHLLWPGRGVASSTWSVGGCWLRSAAWQSRCRSVAAGASPAAGGALDASGAEAGAVPEADLSSAMQACGTTLVLGSQEVSAPKALCLFAALSFHSTMEGMGVGTARSAPLLLSVSVAILAHKGLAAFALGTALRKGGLRGPRIAFLAAVFASGTPLGIALGMATSHALDGPEVAVCTACAAGTFLQVSMMEMIPSALQPQAGDSFVGRAARVGMLVVGFALMTWLVLMLG